MEIFKMYVGHFGIWVFLLMILILNRKINIRDNNFILVLIVFSMLFAVPSCSIQWSFFGN